MASVELGTTSEAVTDVGDGGRSEEKQEVVEKDSNEINSSVEKKSKKKKKKKRTMSCYMPKVGFGCFRMERDEKGNFDMEVVDDLGERRHPTHLLLMVNGLIGSADNWKFAAKQFLKSYPEDLIVHCSQCNHSMLTFDGIDVMGRRLAEEVISVIKRYPALQKISFIGHSLGGLIARYAIAKLYERDIGREHSQQNGECRSDASGNPSLEEKYKGKIAGLEPINFITCATPHLGSRGHKQVPLFCGFYSLEKVACHTSWFLGKTGKHLFLTDGKDGTPPLLLQMAGDCEDLKFLSALQSFRHCVAYANVSFDHLVGWSTSSIRRRKELPKRQNLLKDSKYPHIINVEKALSYSPQQEDHVQPKVNGHVDFDTEEEMIRGLTRLNWERVDVDFRGSKQRYLAHSTIQVKTYCINSDGADVIQHMIDNFRI